MKPFRRNHLIAVVVSLVLVVSIVGLALAAAVTVDTFDDGPGINLTAFDSDPVVSQLRAASTAVGLDHEAVLTWISGTGADVTLRTDYLGSNRLAFSASEGIQATGLIRWDGTGGTADVNDCALPSTNLIDAGPANNGFHVEIVNDDLPTAIAFHVYSGATCTNMSQHTVSLPGGIIAPAHVDFFVPFADFTGDADFTAVRAIEVFIDGTITAGTDVSIDFLDADNFREYGDLPRTNYGDAVVDTYQVPQGHRLGRNVDIEVVSQPDVAAGTASSGDDSATLPSVDDEDGVRPTPGQGPWIADGSGTIDVSYAGCLSNCYLNGWIDWNNDGDFADAGEQVFADTVLATSITQVTTTLGITIGSEAALSNAQRYARFRICPTIDTCDQVSGQNGAIGEIEDYRWEFGPLAVTLNNLEARPAETNNAAIVILGVTLVLAVGTIGLVANRRRKQTTL